MRSSSWIAAIVCAVLTACATTSPPPNRQLAETRASMRIAEEVGAQNDPQAASYLKLARKQIANADEEISLGNYARAEHQLRLAQSNAELATALAREANARAEADQIRQQVDALQTRVP